MLISFFGEILSSWQNFVGETIFVCKEEKNGNFFWEEDLLFKFLKILWDKFFNEKKVFQNKFLDEQNFSVKKSFFVKKKIELGTKKIGEKRF